jgi:EAL domain-containing protein (putative c-di-GMP-specific phosphodiesterase class I)
MPISMAFQPIVSVGARRVFAYEALVRGTDGSGAGAVFDRVTAENRYVFDQSCRSTAIGLASALGMADRDAILSINFLPDAVYDPRACIRVTLDAARKADFPVDRIMFEFVETERVDPGHLLNILAHYRALGFLTAIDDFGAGYAGAGLLCDFVPDVVKLDMGLVRGCDADPVRRTILRHTVAMLQDLGCAVVAEGIETRAEYDTVRDSGVDLVQGYLFAAPGFETLPDPWMPEADGAAPAPAGVPGPAVERGARYP